MRSADDEVECDICGRACHEYDFIVCGVGAGGSSLVRDLYKKGKYSILAVDWGLDLRSDPVVVNVSSEYGQYGPYRRTKNDFMQEVVSPNVYGLVNFEAGKGGPGGSTNHYFGNATRGEQWDDWAEGLDDPKWSYNAILPFAKKVEHYFGTTQIPKERGYKGPLEIHQNHPGNAVDDKLCQIMAKVWNVPILQDYNGDIQNVSAAMQRLVTLDEQGQPQFRVWGGTLLPYSILDKHGNGTKNTRCSKLKVLFSTVADKLLFEDEKNPRNCTGVRIASPKYGVHIVKARKAVVISGGAYSPAILHRSGIGPAAVLKDIGVEPKIINEHVGAHFKCHYGVCLPFDPKTFPYPAFFEPGSAGIAVTFDDGNSAAKYNPTVFTPGQRRFERLFAGTGITEQRLAIAEKVPLDAPTFLVWNLLSRSEGTIFAQSKDPYTEPQVNFNYYSDGDLSDPASDLSIAVAVLKSMKEFSLKLGSEMLLPPDYAFASDESLAIWVKTVWHTTNHYMSTTRMGTSKKNSVCDSNCKLWKVDNVYFADAGVMPTSATGHTSLPVFIIGKIVAKILNKRYG